MILPEALDAMRQAGAHLLLDDQGPLLRGRVPKDVVAVLREHRDRVAAVLKLRELHREVGLSEEEILFCETAILSGRVDKVRLIVAPPPSAGPA